MWQFPGSIPEWKIHYRRKDSPLWYSFLENSINKVAGGLQTIGLKNPGTNDVTNAHTRAGCL